MSEQNLSQWFLLSEQKPWEVGVYEVQLGLKLAYCIKECRHQFQTWFSYWDGEKFSCATGDRYRAFLIRSEKESSDIAVFKWRGLSTNPEVEKKPQGNRKKTMHIVKDWLGETVASFTSKKVADKYASRIRGSEVETIRFRTPE